MDIALPEWAMVGAPRRAHIERVVEMVLGWAEVLQVPDAERCRWQRAGVLHDALRDAPREILERHAPGPDWPASLWHGPAAADRARAAGERDEGVLSAVRYHSVGWAGWDDAGLMLYLADYLEPGRAHDGEDRAALAARVPADRLGVLREVTGRRISHLMAHVRPIPKETSDFWNRLVAAGS